LYLLGVALNSLVLDFPVDIPGGIFFVGWESSVFERRGDDLTRRKRVSPCVRECLVSRAFEEGESFDVRGRKI
jgi:hypothetical protein